MCKPNRVVTTPMTDTELSASRVSASRRPMTDAELRREHTLNEAVKAGKFSASRSAFYRQKYDADPKGTRALIAAMAPISIPEDESRAENSDAYPANWLPEAATPTPPPPPPTAGVAYPPHWLPEVGSVGDGRVIIGND